MATAVQTDVVPAHALTHLQALEAESIHIIREVVAECENPVLLYSIGKDSNVLVRLAQKAFFPGLIPFPLLHVDTKLKFQDMYRFRDEYAKSVGAKLLVYTHPEIEKSNVFPWTAGTIKCCALRKTQSLLNALREGGYDAAIGGARREEEKSRAKERVFSFRDKFGQWDPKNQRPELWSLYNTRHEKGESIRVFPLSNWTEVDIWNYTYVEKLPVNPLYLARERDVIVRGGQLIPLDGPLQLRPDEKPEKVMCRFRTLGCYPCTGAIRSNAGTLEEVIEELLTARQSERITRVIDHDTEGSMEDKKREGYF